MENSNTTAIIHCCLNYKGQVRCLEGQKRYKIEYTFNGGYWSEWVAAYDGPSAKKAFIEENPDKKYNRIKRT